MCGRYAQSRNVQQLRFDFGLPEESLPGEDVDTRAWPPLEELEPDYNISPGRPVYAVLGPPPQGGEAAEPGPRSLHTLRWGLIPSWAKDRNIGYRMINARSETVADKPAFRTAFRRRRCLLPADAYYEWQLIGRDGTVQASTSPATDPDHKKRKAKADKKPYSIHYPGGGEPLAMAGIFERWRDPEAPEEDPAGWVWSCAVITTEAAPELAHIHERMPVIVPRQDWAAWLDPGTGPDELAHIMADTPADRLAVDEVSTDVNTIKNNRPDLLTPLAAGDGGQGPDTLF